MKKLGIVSYNRYCNFTNYGSALQSYALYTTIKNFNPDLYVPVLVNYCPDVLLDADPLNPFEKMWDQDDENKKMVELTMPAIKENYHKFNRFYCERFVNTKEKYTSQNFESISGHENIYKFVCGSDTIFCPEEFGFDDGYYANYPCMKGASVAYAASFGDTHLFERGGENDAYQLLNERLKNFKAIGLREDLMIPYVKANTTVPVQRVLDPTLLLTSEDYDRIAEERIVQDKYLLLYARRYNPKMLDYADKLAKENGWKVIDISLRADNVQRGHQMLYEAGVEEFLSLVKYAEYVVTNSYHGMIFSVQFRRPFVVFSREQCDNKIWELLSLFGITDRLMVTGKEKYGEIDYDKIHAIISDARKKSLDFLQMELELL